MTALNAKTSLKCQEKDYLLKKNKTMDSNFGPPSWMFTVLGWLAAVGFFAACIYLIKSIVWLFNHVNFS